ncbi:unnamed protein product [Trifolium pratense]|uniref:Uncharacterized protein n=1 Tax=Trifolium pratense TaxID=57577 RepID=A0ACB0KY56_TRIPR|nr:unnamed protein product [Trifolium pratense]
MDLTQTLRDQILVERKGFAFFVDVEYENLPDFCSNCKIIGHHVGNCKKICQIDEGEQVKAAATDRKNIQQESKKSYVQVRDGRKEQGKEKEVINVEDTSEKVDEEIIVEPNKKLKDQNCTSKSQEKEPVKDNIHTTGSSSSTKRQSSGTNIVIEARNRFAALGEDNIEDTADNTNTKGTVENSITADTEFVDNTQVDIVIGEETLQVVNQAADSNLVHDTTKFLNQSWANMVEEEEEIEETSHSPQQPPFSIVQAKTGKKQHAQKSITPKKPYGTRSKRLVTNNNPDFVFIAEPWIYFSDLPRGWLARMGLKMFCLNDKGHRKPSLWCFCKDNINPNIILVNDQQVSFSFVVNNQTFCMAAIYASTDYVKRRDLWNCLSVLQQQFRHPWSFIGDFNAIMGAHEHKGNTIPARIPIEDFQNWTDANNLLHLSTSGAFLTWSNGRGGSRHTERRLDRTICNQAWVDAYTSLNCSSLVKNNSDHHPLLFEFNTHDIRYKASFKFMKMWSLHEGCHEVIADSWKETVIGCPMFILITKLKRLKEKLRSWNKGIFGNVHSSVNEAEQDLNNIQIQIQNFGHSDSLGSLERTAQKEVIPNLVNENVNALLTLIPSYDEIKNAVFSLNKDSAPGPDGYGAFFYQKYWEIINEDVVAAVLQFFTSGWIMPSFNSNTIILIPKTNKADSIDQFRPIAMANFKFKIISKVLADRLASILPSIISKEQKGFVEAQFSVTAYLSVSINGSQHGFFNCKRGVRQGDPLSPLLFCLAEEVLSRGISMLVSNGSLDLIKGSKNSLVPSHCLYADDIMVFCNGKLSCIQALQNLFMRYANCSGQIINAVKSTIYSGGISQARLINIVNNIGFNVGSLPFIYLGVPIFKGKPKARYFYPIADKIKTKLSAWKASLLSIAGRVQLVKSVIQGMTIYSISVYSWPSSILKSIEAWIRNFIWSGNIDQRKLVTVAWKKICAPYDEGGLGLRSLKSLNAASNLKLCWDLMHSDEDWAKILRFRVMRKGIAINHHVYSSIWSSVKQEVQVIYENSCWKVGNGHNINFWSDSWCGEPLALSQNVHPDVLIWLPSKSIWSKDIPPSRSLLAWRVMLDKVPTDDKLSERGCNLPSMCSLCNNHSETMFHLFFQCSFAFQIWCWLATVLEVTLHFQSMTDIWLLAEKNWSPQCKIVIKAALIHLLYAIWTARNNARFNNEMPNWKSYVSWISSNISMAGNLTNKLSSTALRDFTTLKRFNVNIHPPNPTSIKEVIWQPPFFDWVKCNTDGAFNAATSACGGLFRNSDAAFLCGFAVNTDNASSAFSAELCGAMQAIEIAAFKNWNNLWLETDSTLVVKAFKSSSLVPWALRNRWLNCLLLTQSMNFVVSHVFREGNFCADSLAHIGLTLDRLTIWNDVPLVIKDSFEANRLGKPFFRVVHI